MVAKLIGDAGLRPVDAGPLQNARYLEPLAMLMIELGYSRQMGSNIAIRLMNPALVSDLVEDAEVIGTSLA